jgi:hypothetical protein
MSYLGGSYRMCDQIHEGEYIVERVKINDHSYFQGVEKVQRTFRHFIFLVDFIW